MKKRLLELLIILFCFATISLHSTELFDINEVRAGLKGYGKTVFKGSKRETFEFKVLGVLEKFAAGKDLIIVEIISPLLNNGGILEGMSGSPLYINGRLLGALSYGFPFSKKPIAGVTPIKDMFDNSGKIENPYMKKNLADVNNWNFKKGEELKKKIIKVLSLDNNKDNIKPLKIYAYGKGISSDLIKSYTPFFKSIASVNEKKLKTEKVDESKFILREADALSVPLIRGDFEYSSSGTVTYVKDKKVYAFGHPFFNLGKVSFPMHRAKVITVVPSYNSGFKMASTLNPVGVIEHDGFSSISGTMGKFPYMIPINIFLKNTSKSYSVEVVQHSLLTPLLVGMSVNNVFSTNFLDSGQYSFRAKARVAIEGLDNIVIDDLYSGNSASMEFANFLMATSYFVMNAKDNKFKIQKIDVSIDFQEELKEGILENVVLDKSSYLPGELMRISLRYLDENYKVKEESLEIPAPDLPKDKVFYLFIGDKKEVAKFDAMNTKINYLPLKGDDIVRILNRQRKNSTLIIKLVTPSRGLFVKGYELSNLPQSLSKMYTFNSVSQDEAIVRYSTLAEYRIPTDTVIKGKKVYTLKIKGR